jgi:hypothetical protein
MNSRIFAWIPGVLAAVLGGGILIWLFIDSPSGDPHSRSASSYTAASNSRSPGEFAKIEAPAYSAADPEEIHGDALVLFHDAMHHYQNRDYLHASISLRQATAIDTGNPEIRFFLGICYLMTNDTRAGIGELRVAEQLGPSPYLERVRYYLAKAFLKRQDNVNARRELDAIIDGGGIMVSAAKKLKLELTRNSN